MAETVDITNVKTNIESNIDNITKDVEKNVEKNIDDYKGFYKLSWLQRIGYGSGDVAQNFIFQIIGSFILFFYTDVYILGGKEERAAAIAGTMMLIQSIIDIIWNPIVGTFVDKHHPLWGKYRSYLIFGGFPLTFMTILCFWDYFKPSIVYAYLTYYLLQMCYGLVNVPYCALNASLTRDTNEITILTSTRIFMANVGGLLAGGGIPLVVALFAGKSLPIEYALFQALGSLPSFIFVPSIPIIKRKLGKKMMFYVFIIIAIFGYALIYIFSRLGVKKYIIVMYIAQFIKSSGLTVTTGYMWALVPEVISYGEYTTGRRISGIVNALTSIFFKAGTALGTAIPGWVLAWTHYKTAKVEKSPLPNDSKAWFITIVIFSLIGLILLIFCFTQTKERVVMDNKDTGNVKISDLWKEFFRNRPLRIISFFFMIAFISIFVHNSTTAYLMNDLHLQVSSAQEGVRWCVSVIPSILLLIGMLIISRYELNDEKIDKINKEIEEKQLA
ncbi:hypothetical protein BCR32DRAFT_265374 [Anaeromyces robustus]|uniref:Sugar/Na+ simporter n=1 Tax=Anaeromyces robustus TaxID=1754192 RepID=A0A1Y1XJA6_9FUNG|nr:hypothetical protein BCR32DRAFT_265374 [Anaeromyces robustus]|eukprot:ORX85831.1 hypothetical protein BCR32DRAFT_265374 [Anaeromyces robustus]